MRRDSKEEMTIEIGGDRIEQDRQMRRDNKTETEAGRSEQVRQMSKENNYAFYPMHPLLEQMEIVMVLRHSQYKFYM